MFSDIQDDMAALADRLKQARKTAKLSQAVLAEKAGVAQSLISDLERGELLSTKFLPEIAKALKIPVANLDERFGEARAEGAAPTNGDGAYRPPPVFFDRKEQLPVHSSAEGGDGALILSTDPFEWVPRPYSLMGVSDAYAILITGESMVPAFKPGQRAWVDPRLPPMRGEDFIFYSVNEAGEERALVKELVSWNDKAWTVQQWNPARKYALPRDKWTRLHRIVGKFYRP